MGSRHMVWRRSWPEWRQQHARERDLVEYYVPRWFGMEAQRRYLEHDAARKPPDGDKQVNSVSLLIEQGQPRHTAGVV